MARALAADPPILLFDEPFGALDPVTRLELQRQFWRCGASLHKTSIFVTHDVREALLLATRIGLLHNGTLELVATPAEFRQARTPEARGISGRASETAEHGDELRELILEHLTLVVICHGGGDRAGCARRYRGHAAAGLAARRCSASPTSCRPCPAWRCSAF